MYRYYKEYAKINPCDFGMQREIGEVKIIGIKTVGIPMWMINNYIKSTCDNYTKLVYILNILDIFSGRKSDFIDIGISTKSVPIDQDGRNFEDELVDYVERQKSDKTSEKYCLMLHPFIKIEKRETEGKEKKEKDFRHYFSSCERPICFAITKTNEVIFLHNPRDEEGIKVCDVSYHSPLGIGLQGLVSCIGPLINAGVQARDEIRRQEEHKAVMVTQAMHTIEEAIRVQSMLENTTLSGGHKLYLQSMYNGLMEKQKKLNEGIGICSSEINIAT